MPCRSGWNWAIISSPCDMHMSSDENEGLFLIPLSPQAPTATATYCAAVGGSVHREIKASCRIIPYIIIDGLIRYGLGINII